MKASLFCAFLLNATLLFSQNQTIDSLLIVLEKKEDGIERIDILNQLASEYIRVEPVKTKNYAQQALTLSQSQKYSNGEALAYRMLGSFFEGASKYDSAKHMFQKSLSLYKRLENDEGLSDLLNDIGILHYQLSDYEPALTYLKESKGLFKKTGNSYGEGKTNINIGLIFMDKGQTDSSFFYLNQAFLLFKSIDNEFGQAVAKVNIGILMKDAGRYTESIKNYEEAIPIFQSLGNKYNEAKIHTNIGVVYEEQGAFAYALEKYQQALKLYTGLDSPEGQIECYDNIGVIHKNLGEYELASMYFLKGLEGNLEQKALYNEVNSYLNLSGLHLEQNQPNQAEEFTTKGLFLADSLGLEKDKAYLLTALGQVKFQQGKYDSANWFCTKGLAIAQRLQYHKIQCAAYIIMAQVTTPLLTQRKYASKAFEIAYRYNLLQEVKESTHLLYQYFKLQAQPDSALKYHELYTKAQDSLFNESSTKKITQLASQFEFDQEKEAIANERQKEAFLFNQELERKNTIQWISTAGIISLIVVAFIIGLLYNKKNQINKALAAANIELERLNETKDKFFSIISHDLRSPVEAFTNISLILNRHLKAANYDRVIEIGEKIDQMASNISNLLDNLLCWSMQRQGHFPHVPEKVSVKEIFDETITLFSEPAKMKQVQLVSPTESDLMLWVDANSTKTIVRNLVANALKFTQDGQIKLEAHLDEGQINIRISDTGVGMNDNQIKRILSQNTVKGSYGTAGESGVGLGLQIVKEFVDRNNGTLTIESEIEKGTTINIFLPSYELTMANEELKQTQ